MATISYLNSKKSKCTVSYLLHSPLMLVKIAWVLKQFEIMCTIVGYLTKFTDIVLNIISFAETINIFPKNNSQLFYLFLYFFLLKNN